MDLEHSVAPVIVAFLDRCCSPWLAWHSLVCLLLFEGLIERPQITIIGKRLVFLEFLIFRCIPDRYLRLGIHLLGFPLDLLNEVLNPVTCIRSRCI